MKRENIEYRENLYKDFDLQQYVLMKSGDRCCHCGKKKYFPTSLYHATIDHFIPLSQGGTNRKHNLIMLCDDCNKEKGQKVVDISYVPYLLQPYRDEIEDYYKSYVASFEYVTRNRLFASDEYKIYIDMTPNRKGCKNKLRGTAGSKWFLKPYILKKTTTDDIHRITGFLTTYSEKRGISYDVEFIKMQAAFWQRFGAIYTIEDTEGISLLISIMLAPKPTYFDINDPYVMVMYVFSRTASAAAMPVLTEISVELPNKLMEEQGIKKAVVTQRMHIKDPLACRMMHAASCMGGIPLTHQGMFYEISHEVGVHGTDKVNITSEDFMANFTLSDEAKKSIARYYGNFMDPAINWLLYDLMTPDELAEYGVFPEDSEEYRENEAFRQMHRQGTLAMNAKKFSKSVSAY